MPQTIRTSIHNMLLYFIKRRHQSAITAHSYMQSRPGIRKAVPRYQNWRTRNCRSKNWRSKIGESELGFQKLRTGLVWFVYPGAFHHNGHIRQSGMIANQLTANSFQHLLSWLQIRENKAAAEVYLNKAHHTLVCVAACTYCMHN